jgi:hypothetical protein
MPTWMIFDQDYHFSIIIFVLAPFFFKIFELKKKLYFEKKKTVFLEKKKVF